jgi:hypothetical protein
MDTRLLGGFFDGLQAPDMGDRSMLPSISYNNRSRLSCAKAGRTVLEVSSANRTGA